MEWKWWKTSSNDPGVTGGVEMEYKTLMSVVHRPTPFIAAVGTMSLLLCELSCGELSPLYQGELLGRFFIPMSDHLAVMLCYIAILLAVLTECGVLWLQREDDGRTMMLQSVVCCGCRGKMMGGR